jgi:alanyl-tRNA synthetase
VGYPGLGEACTRIFLASGSRKLRYLRECQETLDSRRSELKRNYLDVVDEVENLKSDLDAVSKDLDRLSRGQGVELHATIDKFGKTTNLQVHDAPTEDGENENNDPNTGLKLVRLPNVRQVSPP